MLLPGPLWSEVVVLVKILSYSTDRAPKNGNKLLINNYTKNLIKIRFSDLYSENTPREVAIQSVNQSSSLFLQVFVFGNFLKQCNNAYLV